MSNNNPTKFVLKFDLSATRPSVVCEAANFHSELFGDYKFSNVADVKNLLIHHFVAREEAADYDDKQQQQTIWVYNVNSTNATTTVYRAPRIVFWPCAGDFETMSNALTQPKVPATFFDVQIVKHLESAGVAVTRENVRVYRDPYKDQISKLLLNEILEKRTIAHVARWFDKISGNSYFSVSIFDGLYQINVPAQYGYGDAENLVIHALRLECPRTMRPSEYLASMGVTVVDLDYSLKREMFTAAFHI